jgi:nucleotide-binding universal stress UspA family protein
MVDGPVDKRRIVVGVDGSEPSKAALRWGIRQARLVGGVVDAVIAWRYPASYAWTPEVGAAERLRDAAATTLDKTLAEFAGVDESVPVRPVVGQGHPAQVLIDAAVGAELLVVGNRGHTTFAGALIGPISERCVHHAGCPVVVVRP